MQDLDRTSLQSTLSGKRDYLPALVCKCSRPEITQKIAKEMKIQGQNMSSKTFFHQFCRVSITLSQACCNIFVWNVLRFLQIPVMWIYGLFERSEADNEIGVRHPNQYLIKFDVFFWPNELQKNLVSDSTLIWLRRWLGLPFLVSSTSR